MKNFIDTLALDCHQVLHSVNIVLVPLELETFFTSHKFKVLFTLFFRLEHLSIEQVVNLLVIKLHEGEINRNATISSKLGKILEQLSRASLYQTNMVTHISFLYLRLKIAFIVLLVLVAFHGEGLAGTRLSISENCCVIAVAHMTNHLLDA